MAQGNSGSNGNYGVPRIKITFGGSSAPMASRADSSGQSAGPAQPMRVKFSTGPYIYQQHAPYTTTHAGLKRPRSQDYHEMQPSYAQAKKRGRSAGGTGGASQLKRKTSPNPKGSTIGGKKGGGQGKGKSAGSNGAGAGANAQGAGGGKKQTKREKERQRALEVAKRELEGEQADAAKDIAAALPHANPSAEQALAAIEAARLATDQATSVARAAEEVGRLQTDQAQQRARLDTQSLHVMAHAKAAVAQQASVLVAPDLAALARASNLLAQPGASGAAPTPSSRGGPTAGAAAAMPSSHPASMPACAAWYRPRGIHGMERRTFPRWFDSSSASRTPEKYVACRDWMVSAYRQHPGRYLTATSARRALVADAAFVIRLHRFLERWGVINYNVVPQSRPVPGGHPPATHWPVRVIAPLPGTSLDAGLGVQSEGVAGGPVAFASGSSKSASSTSGGGSSSSSSNGDGADTSGQSNSSVSLQRIEVGRARQLSVQEVGDAGSTVRIAPVVLQQGALLQGVAGDSGPSRGAWEMHRLLAAAEARVSQQAPGHLRGQAGAERRVGIVSVLGEAPPGASSGDGVRDALRGSMGGLWTAEQDRALLEAVGAQVSGGGAGDVRSAGDGKAGGDNDAASVDWEAVSRQLLKECPPGAGAEGSRTGQACLGRFLALGGAPASVRPETGGEAGQAHGSALGAIAALTAAAPPSVVRAAREAAERAMGALSAAAEEAALPSLPYSAGKAVDGAVALGLLAAGQGSRAGSAAGSLSSFGKPQAGPSEAVDNEAARAVLAEARASLAAVRRREARVAELERLVQERWKQAELAMVSAGAGRGIGAGSAQASANGADSQQ